MSLETTSQHWQKFGEIDPMWAVLTCDGKRGNKWDEDEFFATGRVAVEEILSYAQDSGANIRFGRALDFGCGVGRLTQALAARFESVVGVDVAESMVKKARSHNRHGDRCQYVVNTADHLGQFESSSFHFILTLIVLQHIEPPYVRRYLAEFMRLLKPGGVLVFQLTAKRRFRMKYLTKSPTFKQRVMSSVPLPVLNVYANVKGRMMGQPPMYAWGMPEEDVVSHIEANGGRVLNVAPDEWGGPSWTSNHYCVVKQ